MINLDDVPNAAKELERAARLGLSGAMITEYPLERRRYAMKAFHPALLMCDLIFSGVFERHPRPSTGHRGVRAGVGAPPALHDGLHLPRAPRRGDVPVQGPAVAEAGDGMLASDFFHRIVVLSFQEDAIAGEGRVGGRQHDVGLRLTAQRVDVSPIAQDPGGDPGRGAGRRTGQACPGRRSGDRRRQHRPRVQF
jgi:hypothetical protein